MTREMTKTVFRVSLGYLKNHNSHMIERVILIILFKCLSLGDFKSSYRIYIVKSEQFKVF